MASRVNTTTKTNTNTTNNAASSLCEYCRQKPKFGGFQYCSKTCAKQVSTLCNHCHKKPKFGNFEYCGKNCAAAAGNGGSGSAPGRNNAINAVGGFSTRKGAKGSNNGPQQRSNKVPANNSGAAFTINPTQIAHLVAQQMPQVQALLANAAAGAAGAALASAVAGTGSVGAAVAPVARGLSVPAQPQPRANKAPTTRSAAAAKVPVNNPFLNSMNPLPNAPAIQNTAAISTLPALDPDDDSDEMEPDEDDDLPECLIPGCEKPIHVDPNGSKASQYCSKKHREEAVADGLVPACIMCLTRPQSEADYFCGRVCREEAMSKAAELST